MNRNEIFKKFLLNPQLKEQIDLNEKQIASMTLYTDTSNKLIEVIKTTIMHLEDTQSIDTVARKVNQFFKQ